MKRLEGVVLLVSLMVALVGLTANGVLESRQQPVHDMPVWFGTEISVAPDADGEELWRCDARLEDLASGEVLSAPGVVFAGGEEASVQSGLPSGMLWVLGIVSRGGNVARWSSRVTLGEQTLSLHEGSVRLAAEKAGT